MESKPVLEILVMEHFWDKAIRHGYVQEKPRSGKCIFCSKVLTAEDIDHSVCNKCWDETFAHQFRADEEDGFCVDCGNEEDARDHQNWVRYRIAAASRRRVK